MICPSSSGVSTDTQSAPANWKWPEDGSTLNTNHSYQRRVSVCEGRPFITEIICLYWRACRGECVCVCVCHPACVCEKQTHTGYKRRPLFCIPVRQISIWVCAVVSGGPLAPCLDVFLWRAVLEWVPVNCHDGRSSGLLSWWWRPELPVACTQLRRDENRGRLVGSCCAQCFVFFHQYIRHNVFSCVFILGSVILLFL